MVTRTGRPSVLKVEFEDPYSYKDLGVAVLISYQTYFCKYRKYLALYNQPYFVLVYFINNLPPSNLKMLCIAYGIHGIVMESLAIVMRKYYIRHTKQKDLKVMPLDRIFIKKKTNSKAFP